MNEYNFYPEWRNEKYYFFADDLRQYPEAWCYIVYGARASGKTYSALRFAYENKIPIMYMKRTKEDVNILCTNENGIDLSPYVPINRDAGYIIQPQLIKNGIGGFYDHVDEEGNIIGSPISYVSALNSMKTIKGIELSFCEWLLFDEFIPQMGEIVRHAEGQMLLDMYMTINRDRTKRGRPSLKLILFANTEQISTPITNELDIVDNIVDLNASGKTHLYIKDREMLLHHITEYEVSTNAENEGIYKAMKNTPWGLKAFGGEFSNDDFTNIGREKIKGFQPVASFKYKNKEWYIWRKDEKIFICPIKGTTFNNYDLDTDVGKYSFYSDLVFSLKNETIEDNVTYSSYSIYDLIMNYRKICNIK